MNHISRREFLFGAAAFGLGGWRLFAAPLGWEHGGKPNLAFGVLSDTHLCSRPFAGRPYPDWPVKYFAAALEYFKSLHVDAVVHCGDLAHRGRVFARQSTCELCDIMLRDSCFLQKRDLAYYDAFAARFRADAGEYRVLVGSSSADIRSEGTLTFDGE